MANPSPMATLRGMVATSAIHDGERDDEDYTGECHPGTREGYLKLLSAWAENGQSDNPVEWINAVAGAGKTAMLRSFCTMLEEKGCYSFASFFVWANDTRRNTLRHFPATIAYQLSRRISALVQHIERAIDNDPLLLQSTFKKQMEQLVIVPLLNASNVAKEERHIIIVVDGLDELDAKGQTQFLQFIPYFLSQLSSLPISLLVSSRPETQITGAFNHPNLNRITSRVTIEESKADILLFLLAKFEEINAAFPYLAQRYGKWPGQEVIDMMLDKSSGFFIWPTVATSYIAATGKGRRHNERLQLVLSSFSVDPWVSNLDVLYQAILKAHAPDVNDPTFLMFKRRLALLCLPVDIARFIWEDRSRLINGTPTPLRAVFEESLDDVWDAVADLSSIFSPRERLSHDKSPLPALSHRSFRDFAFNRARCGDDFYYRSEQELHTEVVCKFVNYFNTAQAYKAAELVGRYIYRMGNFLESHLKKATLTEELGRCMDDVYLDCVPTTWPLLVQVSTITNLFDNLYDLASNDELPNGSLRQDIIFNKMMVFFRGRSTIAEGWNMSLLRLVKSTVDWDGVWSAHSVSCWHISHSRQCECLQEYAQYFVLRGYKDDLTASKLASRIINALVEGRGKDVAQDSLDLLLFILSLSETSQDAARLSPFIPVSDYWIRNLLKHCPPNKELYNALGPICSALLPALPIRDEEQTSDLVKEFLEQTNTFNEYAKRCQEAGIATNSPPIRIPDDWWLDDNIRETLVEYHHEPPTESLTVARHPVAQEFDSERQPQSLVADDLLAVAPSQLHSLPLPSSPEPPFTIAPPSDTLSPQEIASESQPPFVVINIPLGITIPHHQPLDTIAPSSGGQAKLQNVKPDTETEHLRRDRGGLRGFFRGLAFGNPRAATTCVFTSDSHIINELHASLVDGRSSRLSLEAFLTLTTTTTIAPSSEMETLRGMVATSAIHDGERDDEDYTGECHPGTREKYLQDLMAWANNGPLDNRVEWVNAVAGAGKTALLRTFCTMLEEQGRFPPISFFVWRNDSKRNTLKHLTATIAYQLAQTNSTLATRIERAISEDPLLLQSTFKKQIDKLVVRPLLDARDAFNNEHHIIIIVDGLDELDTKGQTEFLNLIPSLLSQLSSLPISLLVSSRPEAKIVGAFRRPKLASITRATRLGSSDEDIWTFLNDKFDEISLQFPYLGQKYGGKWPSHEKRAIMVRQSSGLFIWPTVAINYIDKVEKGLGHEERLAHVLSSTEPKPWVASPLDNLYRTILYAHAPEDRTSFAFFRFKRRLALLCMPISLGYFVWRHKIPHGRASVDWTDAIVRVVYEETLDDIWNSAAGLASLFLPRTPPTSGESPTPTISHRSLRDFTLNRARCGEDLYYSSEQDLHTEIVCKYVGFFNTRQAYQGCAEMGGKFVQCAGNFLTSHLEEAAGTEALGRCMDDISLESVPPTWPLVTQAYLLGQFDDIYDMTSNIDFPDGRLRGEVLLSKITVFFQNRVAAVQEWEIALVRLALSIVTWRSEIFSAHSVQCWHKPCSSQCTCMSAHSHYLRLEEYKKKLANSTLSQHAISPLLMNMQKHIQQDSPIVLKFILSLSETSQRAVELAKFIPVYDYWICLLLWYCPPTKDLYDIVGARCTAPLPDLPIRDEDTSIDLVTQFLEQTKAFNDYTERCGEAGIKTHFPPIKIPDDWWLNHDIRWLLLENHYDPSTGLSLASQDDESSATLSKSHSQLSVASEDGPLQGVSSPPQSSPVLDLSEQPPIVHISDIIPGVDERIPVDDPGPVGHRRRRGVRAFFKNLVRRR